MTGGGRDWRKKRIQKRSRQEKKTKHTKAGALYEKKNKVEEKEKKMGFTVDRNNCNTKLHLVTQYSNGKGAPRKDNPVQGGRKTSER